MKNDDLGGKMPARDDNGLPVFSKLPGSSKSQDPLKDKMKGLLDADQLFDEMPTKEAVPTVGIRVEATSNGKDEMSTDSKSDVKGPVGDSGGKSWAHVLKSDLPPAVSFKYYPIDKGSTLVQPPDEQKDKPLQAASDQPAVVSLDKPESSKEPPSASITVPNNGTTAVLENVTTVTTAVLENVTSVKTAISGIPEDSPNTDNQWTEVKRKKLGNISDCEASPSPPVTFKNLKLVDEVAIKRNNRALESSSGSNKRLTKSQKKKLKASRGAGSPPSLS
ncbi:hypothetical protein ACET3Z_004991 [Daucus carota]